MAGLVKANLRKRIPVDYHLMSTGAVRRMSTVSVSATGDNEDILASGTGVEEEEIELHVDNEELDPKNDKESKDGKNSDTSGVAPNKGEKDQKKAVRKPKIVLPKPSLSREKEEQALEKILSLEPLGLSQEDFDRYKTAKIHLHTLRLVQTREEARKRELAELDQQHEQQLHVLQHDQQEQCHKKWCKTMHTEHEIEDTEVSFLQDRISNLDS